MGSGSPRTGAGRAGSIALAMDWRLDRYESRPQEGGPSSAAPPDSQPVAMDRVRSYFYEMFRGRRRLFDYCSWNHGELESAAVLRDYSSVLVDGPVSQGPLIVGRSRLPRPNSDRRQWLDPASDAAGRGPMVREEAVSAEAMVRLGPPVSVLTAPAATRRGSNFD